MTRVGVRKLGEIDGFRAIDNGLGPAPAAPAYGPGTEGAGIRVCGYALKNSGLIVEVNRQHPHVCVKEPRVKIRSPQGGVVCRVTSGREIKARGDVAQHDGVRPVTTRFLSRSSA